MPGGRAEDEDGGAQRAGDGVGDGADELVEADGAAGLGGGNAAGDLERVDGVHAAHAEAVEGHGGDDARVGAAGEEEQQRRCDQHQAADGHDKLGGGAPGGTCGDLAGGEAGEGERREHRGGDDHRRAEPVTRRGGCLGEAHDERRQRVEADGDKEHGEIGGQDRAAPEQPQLDQGVAGPQLPDGPGSQQRRGDGPAGERGGRGPPPARALGEHQEQPGDPGAEHDGPGGIDAGRAGGALRQHRHRGHQCHHAQGGDEPERRVEPQALGQQPGQGVTHADADGGCDPDQRDGAPRSLGGQAIAGHRGGQRHQAEPGALEGPPGQEHGEPGGQRREHAAGQHDRHRADGGPAAQPPVAEAPHERGGHRSRQQRDGQRPLRGRERHMLGLLHGRQQRCAEARHCRGLDRQEHEHRREQARGGAALTGGGAGNWHHRSR